MARSRSRKTFSEGMRFQVVVRAGRTGQALIESVIVIFFTLILFFGMVQVSRLYAAREVLDYAAARGVRAEAVGFNHFMVFKTVRAGTIPNAGRLLTLTELPASLSGTYDWATGNGMERWNDALRTSPLSPQYAMERSRIPLYLGADSFAQLAAILDYENWSTIDHISFPDIGLIRFEVFQEFPLAFPMHRFFCGTDSIELRGRWDMEDHAALYLDNLGW